jgi:hypothetical protein
MSESILGVIIGGIIGIIGGITGQWTASFFDSKKLKKEKKIEYLRIKRNELEKKYKECSDLLYKSISEGEFEYDMIFNFRFIFPEKVLNAFDEMMEEDRNDPETNNKHFVFITAEMKKSLAEIDREIEEEINS